MIDTKLLRQKILDLAIRGKLVPQDPKDEPASELLKKIKAEKEALIKAGKLKRDKHESFIFRGDDKRYYEQVDGQTTDITKDIPFDLPNEWAWCRLRSLGAIVGGGTPSTLNAAYWNGEIPWLSPADLTDYHMKYISRGKKNITADGLAHSSAVLMPAGSVLYSSRAPIGYVVIAQNAISTNQGFKSLVPAINGLSEFIYYVLIAVTPDIKGRATGTTFKEISGAEFGETLISLPPLAEQQRIVSQIESLLKCVDEIDRESETLEKSLALAKQKILDLAIRGKLVPQAPNDEPASELLKKIKTEKEALIKAGKMKRDKHESFIFRGDDNRYYEQIDGKAAEISSEIPFDLPDNWAWCRLRSLGTIVGGGTPSTLNAGYWNGEIPWLSPADLTDYHKKYISQGKKNITAEGLSHSSAALMPAGSILYSSRAPIGYVVIAQNAISTNQGFKSLVPAINGLSEFLYYVLIAVTPDIKRRATGTTFKEISGTEFGETLVPLSPLLEQRRIVQTIAQYNSILGAISE